MENTDHEQSPKDFEVEITALPQPTNSAVKAIPLPLRLLTRFSSPWHLLLRQRMPVLSSAIGLGVILLLVMVTRDSLLIPVTNTRGQVTSIPPLPPGYNSFYIQMDVPWMQVFIDGQQVKLPRTGIDAPITLKPGSHLIAWRADPFRPQSCRLSIPYIPGDSCNFAGGEVTISGSSIPLQIIVLRESLATLPASQQTGLLNALQTSLDEVQPGTEVQPGEVYLKDGLNTVATQPLQAKLSILPDMQSDTACAIDAEAMGPQPCKFAGQNCWQLCTVSWQLQQWQIASTSWLAFAPVHLSWEYMTSDGKGIASNQPIDQSGANYAPTTDELLLFSISWQHGHWQIRPQFPASYGSPTMVDSEDMGQPSGSGVPLADDPACAAAQNVFTQLTDYTQEKYFSGSNSAAGCLIMVPPSTINTDNGSSATPASWQSALFLQRFGVTLAVNDAAHHLQPKWPLADSYEKTLSQQLLLGDA